MAADFADRTDFDNANRGLVARLEPRVIKASDGRVVYDADAFARTVAGECPQTVHPSLWRQSITLTRPQLLAMLAGADRDGVQLDGDPKVFSTIAGPTDQPDPNFPIVTP